MNYYDETRLVSLNVCRLKSFSFKEQLQFTLDIPKPLLLADVAVRLVQMDFDPFSPQCRTYHYVHPR